MDSEVEELLRDRENEQVERWCLTRALSTLDQSRFEFPLVVVHRDRPDFLLEMAGQLTGVEHTTAIPENAAHAQAMRDDDLGSETYFEQYAEPGERKRSSAAIKEEVENDEPGDGWVGDGASLWAQVILHFVNRKVLVVSKPGFDQYANNWLLVDDQWPNPGVKVEKAAAVLAPLLAATNAFGTFDLILVLRGDKLCEFSSSSHSTQKVVQP